MENQIDTENSLRHFASEVDRVIKGTNNNNESIVLGDTPNIYKRHRAKSLNITMKPSTVHKIAYPKGYFNGQYNLGLPALKELPKQINNPLAILKSNTQTNSIIALTEWEDTNGNPIIVPIHLDKKGNAEFSNQIASTYGKKLLQY